ncbi:MAG: NADH-quinone oxidoreductase subunit H [Eubacterium sp.]|nr:NADH-quinone oxidoreductase subunit H [Eubacterium sp.]MBR0119601.1 NADH-quinone oxidoreductase subunit H [Eubacterium sp.]
MVNWIAVAAYILLAPIIGGLLDGIDRKISARMQRRVGPPLLQPFYDVIKLFSKQVIIVSRSQMFFLLSYMILIIVTGVMFFAGTDILMCFFVMSTGATFLYFAAMVTSTPYSTMGANRELMQMLAYEPAVLLSCVGFYLAEGTFDVNQIASSRFSSIIYLPGFFIAFVFILTIKMRKSPFDLSTSHHMHQELVKGVTTEMGARNLAIFQVTEWYENIFLLGVVGLYIINATWWSIFIAIAVVLVVYFIEILIDNSSARVKTDTMIRLSWGVTALSAGVNLIILMIIK